MFATERRDSFRFDVEPGAAVMRMAGGDPIQVRNLSASGSSLLVRGALPATDARLPVVVELDNGDSFSTRLQVVRVRPHEPGVAEVGARFDDLDSEALTKLSSFIARQHVRCASEPERLLADGGSLQVTNPVFIANLFASSDQDRPRLMFVVDGNVRLPVRLIVEGQRFEGDDRVVQARFDGDAARLIPGHAYTFALSGAGAVTVFESIVLRQRGNEVLIKSPTEVRQTGYRESPRVAVGAVPVEMTVDHPRLAGRPLAVPVQDVAGRGFSFLVDADRHALFPGDRLPALHLQLPTGGSIQADGVIRSISSRGDQEHDVCGAELVAFQSDEDARRWHAFVFQQVHPDLVDGRGRADSAWQVLESSRYIDLWSSEPYRERIRREFIRSWSAPAPEVGHKLILQREDQSVGVSAGSVAYPGTWILHHLAVAPGSDRREVQKVMQYAGQLISGILYRLRDLANLDHFVIYAEKGKRWNSRLYNDFAERYRGDDKLLCTSSRVYRRLLDAPTARPAAAGPTGLKVVRATGRLWSALARHLRQELSPLELRALSYDEASISLEAFSRGCATREYERTRQAYFAMVDGQPVAALLAETGNEGVNVFGLLNTCRIFWLQPQSPANVSAIRKHLLARAVKHYQTCNKPSFVFLDDEQQEDGSPQTLGLEAISPAMRWLAHKDIIPAWGAYLQRLLSASGQSLPAAGERAEPSLRAQVKADRSVR